MSLIADQHEYKKAFSKNKKAFESLYKSGAFKRSRCLLLTYSVECGLKYLLLKQWGVFDYYEIRNIMSDSSVMHHNVLKSHNLEKLLKSLNQVGSFRFPTCLHTSKNEAVNAENYHQYCRYMITSYSHKNLEKVEEDFEKTLLDISKWLDERIV